MSVYHGESPKKRSKSEQGINPIDLRRIFKEMERLTRDIFEGVLACIIIFRCS